MSARHAGTGLSSEHLGGRGRRALGVWVQPGLTKSKFEDSQDCNTEKPYLEKPKRKKQPYKLNVNVYRRRHEIISKIIPRNKMHLRSKALCLLPGSSLTAPQASFTLGHYMVIFWWLPSVQTLHLLAWSSSVDRNSIFGCLLFPPCFSSQSALWLPALWPGRHPMPALSSKISTILTSPSF